MRDVTMITAELESGFTGFEISQEFQNLNFIWLQNLLKISY